MSDHSINKQYLDYLQRVGLSESTMNPVQRVETKRAFYACAASLLVVFRDDIGTLPQPEAIKEMEKLWQEASDFWSNQLPKN